MIHSVDVIKHKRTGNHYLIPHGDPLPSHEYERVARNLTTEEGQKYLTPNPNPKAKC